MAEVTGITVLDVQNPLAVTEAPEHEANLGFANQAANLVLSGPESGAAAYPTFRSLVDADIPAAIARDAEITADIATHAAVAAAHQDAPALIATHTAIATAHQDAPALITTHTTDATAHQDAPGLIATHAAIATVHHTRYTNAEAVTAIKAEDPLDLAGAVSIAKTLTIAGTDFATHTHTRFGTIPFGFNLGGQLFNPQ